MQSEQGDGVEMKVVSSYMGSQHPKKNREQGMSKSRYKLVLRDTVRQKNKGITVETLERSQDNKDNLAGNRRRRGV